MVNKLVLFLLRKKFKLKKFEHFKYANQKDICTYYFSDDCIIKDCGRKKYPSHVAINWLLNNECKIIKV